jgi:hypothetical protein
MERHDSDNGQDLYDVARGQTPGEQPRRPEQEHPVQDAHGGSMAPGLVDDTGHPAGDPPAVSS